ncbi:hypothetical protein TREES_T100007330 [Tupaia chinensis]|uniref:Uncharacterized protein n=1 Tax=Tupaia chinensis TaxID=246437 RepID=L9KZV9_TUPCH|nr:hypothetical protein TREES_T100007330 [Tupaia chinensis]
MDAEAEWAVHGQCAVPYNVTRSPLPSSLKVPGAQLAGSAAAHLHQRPSVCPGWLTVAAIAMGTTELLCCDITAGVGTQLVPENSRPTYVWNAEPGLRRDRVQTCMGAGVGSAPHTFYAVCHGYSWAPPHPDRLTAPSRIKPDLDL